MKTKIWLGIFVAMAPVVIGFSQEKKAVSKPPEKGDTPSDFVRFVEAETPEQSDALQTAVARYERKSDGVIVDLVSVVHIADASYYAEINELLQNYDAVLYELVGGEFQKREEDPIDDPDMESIKQVQGMAQRILDLEHQLGSIDYEPKNFVHADVTWDEFTELMTEKNQSMATLFQRAFKLANDGELDSMPISEANSNRMMIGILGSLASGDSSGLKRTIAPILSESELLISKLEGEDGTVIVSERNKVVMKKLAEQMQNSEKKKNASYAIFYGAGHMPDLQKRLEKEKFEKT